MTISIEMNVFAMTEIFPENFNQNCLHFMFSTFSLKNIADDGFVLLRKCLLKVTIQADGCFLIIGI